MINSIEDLRSGGVLPTGPVSAWPKERNVAGPDAQGGISVQHATKVNASVGQMAQGLVQNAARAVRHGRVDKATRDERYSICQGCPMFIKKTKRCADCGCFMEAKTWLNYPADKLCPQKKWKK